MTWSKTLLKTVLPMLLMTDILGKSQLNQMHYMSRQCSEMTRIYVTRNVPYTETFQTRRFLIWRVQSRLNFKIEKEPGWNSTQVCCKGYKDIGGNIFAPCMPVCNEACVHGVCAGPNWCLCDRGYERISTSNICKPICSTTCINANCTAPDTCTCNQGYTADEEGNCKPNCTGNYPANAYCSAPDTFACNEGYNETRGADGLFECRPLCKPGCINGECVAPDTCNCTNGYTPLQFNKYYCQATCEPDCRDGSCTAPNTCECHRGFKLSAENQCLPSCTDECFNGFCDRPEHCSCHDGYSYKMHGNGTFICAPHCQMLCIHGECIAPNICQCKEGYELDETKSIEWASVCRPSCTPDCGPYGKCIAPNTCNCSEGYQLSNQTKLVVKNNTADSGTICVPICNITCVNAACIEPNVCSCYSGYEEKVNETSNWCAPICEEECGNSTCVQPNECQCWDGFVHSSNESNSTCISACDRNCSNHGVCANGQNNCECNFGWAGANCDESTRCVITLDFNNTDIDQIVARNETNSTILDAKDILPKCEPCANFLNNETLCYVLLEKNTTTLVTCFINTEMACFDSRNYESAILKGHYFQLIPIIIVCIIVLAVTIATIYIIIKRHIRKRRSVPVSPAEPMFDELLLAEPMSDIEINLE